jgi:hypothetical protein
MRTLRLWNKAEKPLRVRIEPRGAAYDIGPNAFVDMKGFDPAEEVLDAIVQTDRDGATVTLRSSNQIVFFVGEQLPPLRRGYLRRMGSYFRRQSDLSRTTTLRIENKTDDTLGLWVEPNPDYYHLAAGKIAELRGFDPSLDRTWDFSLVVRPDETFVSVGPFGEITAVVAGERLPNVLI